MQIITDYNNCPDAAKNAVIALGNFDGIHKGHVEVIKTTCEIAKKKGVPSAVMTFEPHPLAILKPDTHNFRITNAKDKASLIAEIGVDYLFQINFTEDFSKIIAKDFINSLLVEKLQVNHVVIGYDFIFGYKREGSSKLLLEEADKNGYELTKLDAIKLGEDTYSSTKARKFIKKGNMAAAQDILGRRFAISGKVIKGDQRGKTIGFPTANIDLEDSIRPALGVYAVKVRIGNYNKLYNGVANIGKKPTFDDKKELLEVYIFNYIGDLYGQELSVELVKYIRPEVRFHGIEGLKAQIEKDCAQALNILSEQEHIN